MATGTVKWFNGEKGFGFISRTLAALTSSCISARLPAKVPQPGGRQKVDYETSQGPKGLQAVNVRVVH